MLSSSMPPANLDFGRRTPAPLKPACRQMALKGYDSVRLTVVNTAQHNGIGYLLFHAAATDCVSRCSDVSGLYKYSVTPKRPDSSGQLAANSPAGTMDWTMTGTLDQSEYDLNSCKNSMPEWPGSCNSNTTTSGCVWSAAIMAACTSAHGYLMPCKTSARLYVLAKILSGSISKILISAIVVGLQATLTASPCRF